MKKILLMLLSLTIISEISTAYAAKKTTIDPLEKKNLIIYTYSSFTSGWGPGPKIKIEFEKFCNCTIKYISFDDGVSLLTRLKFENKTTKADLILGIDNNLIVEARNTGLFATYNVKPKILDTLDLPVQWNDDFFLPFDYGWFAFIYHKDRVVNPPRSMEELINSRYKLLLQDPRTSTPGLGMVLWIRKLYRSNDKKIWKKLNKNIVTYSKDWSASYGLFLKGEADMVLSYTTSPAYHSIIENNASYAATSFSEGHYMQIEVAGKIKNSQNEALADEFLEFMLSRDFQKHIPQTNWMYPAVKNIELPRRFKSLPRPTKTLLFNNEEINENRKSWTKRWLYAK